MRIIRIVMRIYFMLLIFSGCDEYLDYPSVDRHDKLPADIVKVTPETDVYPPILYSTEFFEPVPLGAKINTSGAEDSPFVTPDGNAMYFFFTPDVGLSAEQQLFDEVSGVWVSYKTNDSTWTEAERVWLQEPGKISLDGAVCVQGNEMWFASAREGYTGVNMFTTIGSGSNWDYWEYCGDRLMKEIQIGEVHIHGDDLYFHSDRTGGLGDLDIWVTTRDGYYWSDPINITEVNTNGLDGFPFISTDGNEMWLMRTYLGSPAIYRSKKISGNWQEPELIVSQFAGEPTLDDAGNLYFVHHFYAFDEMIEADIYMAARKEPK